VTDPDDEDEHLPPVPRPLSERIIINQANKDEHQRKKKIPERFHDYDMTN
jgi:hypothetical protein